jgi:hypothetical protein
MLLNIASLRKLALSIIYLLHMLNPQNVNSLAIWSFQNQVFLLLQLRNTYVSRRQTLLRADFQLQSRFESLANGVGNGY